MENKNLLIGIIVVIIILLIIGGVYYFENKKSTEEVPGQGELSNQGAIKQTSDIEVPDYYQKIYAMDKSGCSEIEDADNAEVCLRYISLIETAKVERNTTICIQEFDGGMRAFCIVKINEGRGK